MPITIRHSVDPSLLAELAFDVGQGERYDIERQRSDQMRQFRQQLNQRDDQFEEELRFREDQAALDRQHQLRLNQQQQQGYLDQVLARNEGYLNQQQLQNAQRDAELQQKLQSGQYRYTPAQQKRMNQLSDAYARVLSDPSIPEPVKRTMLTQMGNQYGLTQYNPSFNPFYTGLTPEQEMELMFKSSTYTDKNGVVYTKKNDGSFQKIYEPPSDDIYKTLDKIVDMRTITTQDDAGNPSVTLPDRFQIFNDFVELKAAEKMINDFLNSGQMPDLQQEQTPYTGRGEYPQGTYESIGGIPVQGSPVPTPTPTPTTSAQPTQSATPTPTPTNKKAATQNDIKNMKEGDVIITSMGVQVKKEGGKYKVYSQKYGIWMELGSD